MFDTDFNFDIDPFEPISPGGTNGRLPRTAVAFEWGDLVGPAISLVGGLLEGNDDGSSSSTSTTTAIVQPRTVSGNVVNDMDFTFDQEFTESMKALSTQLAEWADDDRSFFEDTFVPFQASLMDTNQAILPAITANSTLSLEQNMKDLLGSEQLKKSFRENISSLGADIGAFATSFADQIDDIPTAAQRVGEAVSGIEQKFGQAGAELKKAMGAKGLDVSEAGLRNLAISKAEALSGGVGAAKEAARKEKLAGTSGALGVLGTVQASQSEQLGTQQELTQAGALLTPQVTGVQDQDSVSKAGELGAGLTETGAGKVLGTGAETKTAEFTAKGVVQPTFFDAETGTALDPPQDSQLVDPSQSQVTSPAPAPKKAPDRGVQQPRLLDQLRALR
jgi:hypothetical protein